MSNEFVRNLRDSEKEVVKALPAAGASNSTSAIDLEQTIGGQLEQIAFEIEFPALPNLVDTKKVTSTIEDSADNVTFATVAALATYVRTGAGGVGAAAASRRFRLPPDARRYVRLTTAVEAAGGDNTAKSVTLRALF